MGDLISTGRLDLIPMTPDFLRLTTVGARAEAEAVLGWAISAEWYDCAKFAARRLRDFDAGRTSQPWLPRAVVARELGSMVGYIGFHTPPAPDYLEDISPGAVEFGYQIFAAYRRRGFASEASRALMQWAVATHGVPAFVLSVSPTNVASLGMAAKLGFRRIGSHIDEEDGPEDIFELVADRARR